MPPKKQKSEKTLTNAQEEEMSSALIAQLLAEDGMENDTGGYYAEYGNDRGVYDQYRRQDTPDDSYEEESEDDYRPKPGKRGRGGKRGGSGRGGASRGGGGKFCPDLCSIFYFWFLNPVTENSNVNVSIFI